MPQLATALGPLLLAAARGSLPNVWGSRVPTLGGASVGIVLASAGYPEAPAGPERIEGLDRAADGLPGLLVALKKVGDEAVQPALDKLKAHQDQVAADPKNAANAANASVGMVGNMDGAARAAEWADRGLIFDTRCYVRGGIERIVEEEGAAAAALQYPRCYSTTRARERRLGLGALGTPAAGLRPRPAREK